MIQKILDSIKNNIQRIFVADSRKEYSYADLNKSLHYFCNELCFNNYSRVMIIGNQGFFSYSLILASYLVGATFCIINPELPNERKEYLIGQFKPDVIFCDEVYRGQSCFANHICYNIDFEKIKDEMFSMQVDFFKNKHIYVMFTSGSTGLPKGCRIWRKSVEKLCNWAIEYLGIEKNVIYGQYVPIHFDMSLIDIFCGVMQGVTLIPFDDLTKKLRPANLIFKYKISFINVTPQFLDILESSKGMNGSLLASLKTIRFGGDKIYTTKAKKLFSVLPNINIISTYGPTETTFFCFCKKLTKTTYQKHATNILTIGTTIPGWNMYLDCEQGQDEGEIVIYGDYIGDGYINDDANSLFKNEIIDGAEVKIYHTGDYAKYVNGDLFFTGRHDAQIKINGHRISLIEIECAAIEIGLSEVATFFESKKIYCFYVNRGNLGKAIISAKLGNKLPNYSLPNYLIELEVMPYSSNGKIDKLKLRKMIKEQNYE